MSANTKIQWCDHTHNPWRGCRKVAPECLHCYITTTVPFRTTGQTHGSVRVRASAATLREPLRWNRTAELRTPLLEMGYERPRVFCLSLGDWLDDENVPVDWLAELLATIHATPHLDWLLLTKRPQNFADRIDAATEHTHGEGWQSLWTQGEAPANVWIGVSAGADQAAALAIPARIHFLSAEPMLKAVDLSLWMGDVRNQSGASKKWVILGGESGSNARPCHVDWIRAAVRECQLAGVPVFVKQLGSNPRWNRDETRRCLKDSHGGDMSEWPDDLRIREFPRMPELLAYEHKP